MKSRCLNPNWPNYHHYGGRGITVCERWRGGFEAFFEDMGPRPGPGYSIERVNNDGDYTPENCRWATRQEQLRNTRQTMRLTWNGETLTTFEWAERTGIPAGTIRGRIVQGWSVEEALTLPARTWRPKGHRLTFDG